MKEASEQIQKATEQVDQTNETTNQAQRIHLSMLDTPVYSPTLNTNVVKFGNGYVYWGKSNCYPDFIWDLYNSCGILQSVIDGLSDYTFGKGIINNTGINEENIYGDAVSDVVEKIILDRWIYGGFAIQVKFNLLGEVIGISHIDMRKCRIDEHGKHVYVHDKWNNSRSFDSNYIKFRSFNPETGGKDGVQIYYHRGPKTRSIYPIPDYNASIISCEIQKKIKEFQINELDNNFTSSGIINFNNGSPSDDKKREIEEKVNKKYAGTRNAARMMVSFNEDTDHAVTFQRLGTDDFPERYNSTNDSSRSDIFISLRAHPQLFGMTVSTGFADIEYDRAFELLNKTHILKKQNEIKRVFAKIFGKANAIDFMPFEINKEEENNTEMASSDSVTDIPNELFPDLTTNERRALIGYPELPDQDAEKSVLADRLGVGGTEAMVNVVQNTDISASTKAGLLSVLFGLNNQQINEILYGNAVE